MPCYTYCCEKCEAKFELVVPIKDYVDQPKCEHCNSKKTHRLYMEDIKTLNTSIKKSDSELKTLGDLANRNRDRLSQDHKISLEQKHNDYKEEPSQKELPKGMSRIQKPKFKTKWTS